MLVFFEIMSILLQDDHYFILAVHNLIALFFFLYITSLFLNIWYVSISDGCDDVCTWAIIVHHISNGLQWIHMFVLSLLIFRFGHTFSFFIEWIPLHYFLMPFHFLLPFMPMSAYNFFLPTFSAYVYMFELITSLLDLT